MSKNNIIIMCAPHRKKKDPVTPQQQQQPPGPMILRSHCVWLIVVRTVVIVVQFVNVCGLLMLFKINQYNYEVIRLSPPFIASQVPCLPVQITIELIVKQVP